MKTTDHDPFEERLLTALKADIDERSSGAAVTPIERTRRRWAPLAVAATVGVTALAVGAATWMQPTPAFALGGDEDTITVTINRLEGAEALEQAFAERGVKADVTYTDPGTICAAGRFDAAPAEDIWVSGEFSSDGSQSFTVPASALDDSETLVVTTSWDEVTGDPAIDSVESWFIELGVAQGDVAPCEQIPVDRAALEKAMAEVSEAAEEAAAAIAEASAESTP